MNLQFQSLLPSLHTQSHLPQTREVSNLFQRNKFDGRRENNLSQSFLSPQTLIYLTYLNSQTKLKKASYGLAQIKLKKLICHNKHREGVINYDNNKDKENKKCKKIRTIQTNGSYWWEMVDSNHRRRCQQIYSLSPLATREISHIIKPTILSRLVFGAGGRT